MCSQKECPTKFETRWLQEIPFSKEPNRQLLRSETLVESVMIIIIIIIQKFRKQEYRMQKWGTRVHAIRGVRVQGWRGIDGEIKRKFGDDMRSINSGEMGDEKLEILNVGERMGYEKLTILNVGRKNGQLKIEILNVGRKNGLWKIENIECGEKEWLWRIENIECGEKEWAIIIMEKVKGYICAWQIWLLQMGQRDGVMRKFGENR